MNEKKPNYENNKIDAAVNRAISNYIKSRRAKVPHFVEQYFSFRSAVRLNKKALGSDLYKAPVNILWAFPYTGLKASSSLLKRMGLKKIPSLFERLPVGFETNVQKEVNWLIYTELLEIPYTHGKRKSNKDALFEEILNQPEISSQFISELSQISSKSNNPKFRPSLEKNLTEYSKSRIAAADLAGSIITLAGGAALFKKMTPGAMAIGGSLATAVAQQAAISHFILGTTLGGFYYSIFPVSASVGLVIASTGTIMAALAILTSFSGIITDPIQSKLGIHQKRLKKLIDCLGRELRGLGDSKFKIKDQYVARVFDLLDLFRAASKTLV